MCKISKMADIKIKINKVSNLTDARYFAAMGVDYLGFCCNTGTEMYCSPSKIKDIIGWVEGPLFVLEFDGWQAEEDIKALIDSNLGHAIHFGAFSTYKDSFGVPVFKDYILENLNEDEFENTDFPVVRTDKNFNELTITELTLIKKKLALTKSFLDIQFDELSLPKILDTLPIYGLILRGGEEEKVGFKSYEELDKIFDVIRI